MNKEIAYQGKKVFYRVSGNGRPVMLVHGFGEDGEIWSQAMGALKETATLIVPDLPGSGHSPMVTDMSMEGLAEVLHGILHAEQIETCTMIGHSMGGYITMAFAEKYPNHLRSFGLFHSSAYADPEEKKATRRKGIAFIREHGAGAFLATVIPNLFSGKTKKEHPELIEKQSALGDNFSPDALVSYYEAMMQRPDRTGILRETTVPVLFIMGKYDTAVPVKDSLEQCHLPEKSYIHMLAESGHMGMLEEPGKSNLIVGKFIAET